MAAQIADRLTVQEQEIRWLSDEIGRLLDLGTQGTVQENPSPELEQLRAENEKLKYRIAHLQRSLQEEQERGRLQEKPLLDENQARPQGTEKPRARQDEGEKNVKQQAAFQNKKKEKKASKEGEEQKQEEDLKEPASTIILKRLEKIRELTTIQDQTVSDQYLPTLLEQCEESKFRSADTTWTVLFQDPSPDTYLLLLKRGSQGNSKEQTKRKFPPAVETRRSVSPLNPCERPLTQPTSSLLCTDEEQHTETSVDGKAFPFGEVSGLAYISSHVPRPV